MTKVVRDATLRPTINARNPAASRQATTIQNPREETMKIRYLLALVGLAISFALPSFAQQKDAITDPQIIEQLHAIGKKTDEAMLKGDIAARVALFTEDAVFVTPGGPLYGRQAIEQYYKDLFKKVRFLSTATTYPNSPHQIGTDGNAVWENGEWSSTLMIQGQSGPVQLKGYWASIRVRDGDTWKIRLTTNTPAATAAATPSPTATPSNQ
jgi:uncharacterized protein (TIGR02246 family)